MEGGKPVVESVTSMAAGRFRLANTLFKKKLIKKNQYYIASEKHPPIQFLGRFPQFCYFSVDNFGFTQIVGR